MPASDIGEFIVAAPDSTTLRTPFQAGVYHARDAGAEAAIQNAIDDLPTTGGTIRILAGNYSLNRISGQPYCILIDKSNIRILFDAGAVLKLADSQFNSETGHIFRFGVSGSATLRSNLVIWGPGTIDGNRDNQTLAATPSGSCLHFFGRWEDVKIGGGLQLNNAAGTAILANATGSQNHKRWKFSDLTMKGNNDGFLGTGIIGFLIDNLLIDDTIAQDAFEVVGCADLMMTNSHIRNFVGSAIDIFSNNTASGRQNKNHVYSNCIFGPAKSNSNNCIDIHMDTGANFQTQENITFNNCIILMGNFTTGIRLKGETATKLNRHISFNNCIIDGIDSQANSNGVVVDDFCENIHFNNLMVHDCGDNGMVIDGGNTAADNPTRIFVNGGAYYNNDKDQQGGSGIMCDRLDDTLISGAYFYDTQAVEGGGTATQNYGVDLSLVADALVVDVHNCNFEDNVSGGVNAGGNGTDTTGNFGAQAP
ncbi:MAG: hypothetical protein V3S55_09395 [Nitrospiraceae bacterium]